MTLFKKPFMVALLGMVLFALAARPAQALVFTLSTGNAAISGYPAPYGTVTIADFSTASSSASITFQAAAPSGYTYLFGDGGSVALNTNGAATYSGASPSGQPQSSPSTPILTSGGAGNQDGFGQFNFSINNFDGFGYAFTTLTFTLNKTTGTWSSAADVLSPNSLGNFVAAHIYVMANSDTTLAAATGFAANGASSTEVPDGGLTISLLGLALGALGFAARHKN